MSLPKDFTSPDQYFQECLTFFQTYQHLYNFANTEILTKNVLEHIKIDHLDKINVFEDNFSLEEVNEKYLNHFFEKLHRLEVIYNDFEEIKCLEDIFDVPLSPKKKHEIVYLAKEIKEMCESIQCDTIVDFGSGLGYLDQQLFETANFKVLGLECNESHYVGAKKRQRKYHENSLDSVKYIRHTITEESNKNIQGFLADKFENRTFCITGLHACADLTIDAINLFLKMADARGLVLMPCCYHKMTLKDSKFKNFPLSCKLKNIFESFNGFEFMKVPFLRLGAQPPNVSDKLKDSVFNLLARAVLEKYAQTHNCTLKRNKRKAVKLKTMENDFESYIQDASDHGFSLINESSDKVAFDLEKLRTIWRQNNDLTAIKAGIFVLLQNQMQPIIENLILFDRLMYLEENGVNNCKFKKIFNEKLSPRCLALLASK